MIHDSKLKLTIGRPRRSSLPNLHPNLNLFFTSLFLACTLCAQDPGPKSRVAYLENPGLLSNYNPDPEGVKTALASLLSTLTGKSNTSDAWKSLGIGPDDVVAIKINARGDGRTSTRRALTDAVTASLVAAGLKPDQITLWDKQERDMVLSGYPLRKEPGQIQVRAVQSGPRSEIGRAHV